MRLSTIYLVKLIIIILAIYGFIVITQYSLYKNNMLPAKPVSSSLSFNEKLAWIAEKNPLTCELVLAGSSIALNNTVSDVYHKKISKKFINIASWGMTIRDTDSWLSLFMKECVPNRIVLLLGVNDFRKTTSSDHKNFHMDEISEILSGKLSSFDYMNIRDTYYVLKNLSKIDNERESRKMKGSLSFDKGGSVPISYRDWSVAAHWLKGFIGPDKIDAESYTALSILLGKLNQKNIETIIVLSPIRRDMLSKKGSDFSEFQKKIRNIREKHGASLLDMTYSQRFSNDDYVDTTHLNEQGAEKLSNIVVNYINQMY